MARRELGPASLAVVQAVSAALTEADRHLLVACSGGADSLALAFAAHRVATRLGRPVGAAVVDHGLQPGSAAVAVRARDQLSELGLSPVRVLPIQIDPTDRSGPEGAARAARYAALDAEAAADQATVLLGHTLDDQAETVLLGLARGSGTRSLAGMAARSGRLLRPLLGLRRSVTQQACYELGLEAWTDPQNADRQFSRVRVRHSVLPTIEAELGPGIAEALAGPPTWLAMTPTCSTSWPRPRTPALTLSTALHCSSCPRPCVPASSVAGCCATGCRSRQPCTSAWSPRWSPPGAARTGSICPAYASLGKPGTSPSSPLTAEPARCGRSAMLRRLLSVAAAISGATLLSGRNVGNRPQRCLSPPGTASKGPGQPVEQRGRGK